MYLILIKRIDSWIDKHLIGLLIYRLASL